MVCIWLPQFEVVVLLSQVGVLPGLVVGAAAGLLPVVFEAQGPGEVAELESA